MGHWGCVGSILLGSAMDGGLDFIVIKNLSRTPFESSEPMDRDHKPQHPYEPVTNV